MPVVYKMSIERNNFWTLSKIIDKRGDTYRQDLMKEMGYTNKRTATKDKRPKCIISGIRASGDKVVCGHIVPCGSELVKLQLLGITTADLNLPRNCVSGALALNMPMKVSRFTSSCPICCPAGGET